MIDENGAMIARIDERTEIILSQMGEVKKLQDRMAPELAILVQARLPDRVRSVEFWVKGVGGAVALATFALVAIGRWNDFFR